MWRMVYAMTTVLKCDFWVSLCCLCGDSELQLHQVGVVAGMKETARRQVVGQIMRCRELSDDHRDFIACVAPGTVFAVLQYFVG